MRWSGHVSCGRHCAIRSNKQNEASSEELRQQRSSVQKGTGNEEAEHAMQTNGVGICRFRTPLVRERVKEKAFSVGICRFRTPCAHHARRKRRAAHSTRFVGIRLIAPQTYGAGGEKHREKAPRPGARMCVHIFKRM